MTDAATPRPASSTIASHTYDPAAKTLRVKFHSGGKYEYADVPPEVAAGFETAESLGKHFHANVRGKFQHKRLP